MNQSERLQIEGNGTIKLDDYPLPMRINGQYIEFWDKDRRRSARRGSQVVRIRIASLLAALTLSTGGTSETE